MIKYVMSHDVPLRFVQPACEVDYVRTADRLMAILAEEGIARLPSVKPQAGHVHSR